ncbi:MAG: type II toxin-antitoxin system VapC family toxin [Dechloromonas sp.]|uniref:type II toxin-antitoxin system VapC family toxin n=1 Tax=Azonexus sp. TaxID=1872668 RepID=UPI0035B24EBF|nr:type II toxin-antitoxin system VapC family toxin [Dechloromonas sp.]
MKLLLDTHALLWSIIEPERLSPTACAAITDPAAQVAVSAVSFWEIAIKTALGKLSLSGTTPEALVDAAQQQGFDLLPLDPRLAASFTRLPVDPQHRDPFDRMLVWQALSLGYKLVSRDRKISTTSHSQLQTLW